MRFIADIVMDDGINKTVFASVCVGFATIVLIAYWYIAYLKEVDSDRIDKFTNCLQVVMSRQDEDGNFVNPREAKDICVHAKGEKVKND